MADAGAGEEPPGGADRAQTTIERLRAEIAELRSSRARLLRTADADRRSLERSLHDGLQQQLVALVVGLRRASDLVEADPAAATASLAELTALVGEATAEAARLAQWIYPPRLHDSRGLTSALRSAADRANVAATIQVSTAASAAPETFAGVYWCCAEALTAAPAGTHATVSVVDVEGGVGFEVGVVGTYSEGWLERVRDRVEALGGWLRVEDGGSRVEGMVPSAWG